MEPIPHRLPSVVGSLRYAGEGRDELLAGGILDEAVVPRQKGAKAQTRYDSIGGRMRSRFDLYSIDPITRRIKDGDGIAVSFAAHIYSMALPICLGNRRA